MNVMLGCVLGLIILSVMAGTADAHNCKCRNRGVYYSLGSTACLNVDGQRYLARCEMKLNVSSWTRIENSCPVSDVDILDRAAGEQS